MSLLSPRRTHRAAHRLMHRFIVTVVAMSLLSMPVTYRGGAEAAHAHTIFQLWRDVRSGSFTHHMGSDGPARRHAPAGGDQHATTGGESATDGEPTMGGMTSAGVVTTDPVDLGPREPVKGSPTGTTRATPNRSVDKDAPTLGVDEDAPTVGTAFTPSVRDTAVALPAMPSVEITDWPSPDAWRLLRLEGIANSPTAPPPRRAA